MDGDTVRVRVDRAGGRLAVGEHRVRLLEIDSPEVVGEDGAECGADAATAFVRRRLPPGTPVALEADRADRDRFDRPLRYLWLGDELLNATIVRRGHARAVLFAPNDRHWLRMTQAQAAAQERGAGIWGACG